MTSYQVAVAAESFVASLLSQAGYDVSVQYGANQPGYDLVAVKPDTEPLRTLLVSVKGTQLEGWIFSASHLEKGKGGENMYHIAAEAWLEKQGRDLVLAYVQFCDVAIGQLPEVYVARAHEVAAHVKTGKGGIGDTTLRWKKTWKSGIARGITDTPPDAWKFSQARIDSV